MINDAVIKRVKYFPELIPDSFVGNIPLNAEFTPPVLDLKRFSPYLVNLTNIQVIANANVELRARYDDRRVQENTAAMQNLLDGGAVNRGFPGAWQLPAISTLYLNFFGVAATANFTSHYGIWAIRPTIAHKLLWGTSLNADEQVIADKLNIAATVSKGLLPLPIPEQIEREYTILGEETHSRSINITAANTVFSIENLYPKKDECLILTRIAAAPGLVANAVRFHVDRDNDVDFANVLAFPLSLAPGGEIACFIPAMTEIKLYADAVGAAGATLFRYSIIRVKLSNILRMRFGLLGQVDNPDLYERVVGGIV